MYQQNISPLILGTAASLHTHNSCSPCKNLKTLRMLQLVYFPNILSDAHKETLFCICYVSLLYVKHSTCNLYTDAV